MTKFRSSVIIGLLALIVFVAACDSGTEQPTPTVVAPTPTQADAGVVNTPAPPDAEATATLVASSTDTPSASKGEALTLNPVTVETNDQTRHGVFSDERTINLPPGFHVRVFANDLPGVRWLGLGPDGLVYATVRGEAKVVTLKDTDNDGVADETKVFADRLEGVHGVAFKDGAVYVATEGEIIRLEDTDGNGLADLRDVIASDLPTGGGHSTRTIAFGPDGKLYVSAGSSCNVCVESDEKRAAISLYSAAGEFEKIYASGLRNAVGILFHPVTGELWATNNGRDNIGDDTPPESIYNVKEDTDYGWPYCYGDQVPDETQNPPAGFCEKTGLPAVNMQAHSAPLGLEFYTGDQFPPEFKGDMFVAFHGSWNRSTPTGYKLVRIRMKDNQPDASAGDLLVEDFATGWLARGFLNSDDVWGRPVDPMVGPDGSLLLTDDKAGVIYSIYYQENAGP